MSPSIFAQLVTSLSGLNFAHHGFLFTTAPLPYQFDVGHILSRPINRLRHRDVLLMSLEHFKSCVPTKAPRSVILYGVPACESSFASTEERRLGVAYHSLHLSILP